jgi:hypothetical protein
VCFGDLQENARQLLGSQAHFEIACECVDASGAVGKAGEMQPNVVILQACPTWTVLKSCAVSGQSRLRPKSCCAASSHGGAGLEAGARGYLLKSDAVRVDNLSAHKTKAVRDFLQQHPRVRFHFTPTYSSWLNQVEIWLAKMATLTRHNSPACCLRSCLEFFQMRLCQIRLFQLQIEICQEKMNLGIAGAELWQSQGSFSFQCSIFEISLVV